MALWSRLGDIIIETGGDVYGEGVQKTPAVLAAGFYIQIAMLVEHPDDAAATGLDDRLHKWRQNRGTKLPALANSPLRPATGSAGDRSLRVSKHCDRVQHVVRGAPYPAYDRLRRPDSRAGNPR